MGTAPNLFISAFTAHRLWCAGAAKPLAIRHAQEGLELRDRACRGLVHQRVQALASQQLWGVSEAPLHVGGFSDALQAPFDPATQALVHGC